MLGLKSRVLELAEFINRERGVTFYWLRRNILSVVGAVIVIFFVLIALLAPILASPIPGEDPYICPYDGPANREWVTPAPVFPSSEHLLGTLDGYDIYYGCVWGTRTAFRIGLLAISIELVIGLLVGCIAGYFGGFVDELLMRFTDIFFAIPGILLAMIVTVALPDVWSFNLSFLTLSVGLSIPDKLAIALAIVGWPLYTRLIRGEIIRVKNEDYVEAAKAIGCSSVRIMIKHILPNVIYPVLIMAFLGIGWLTLSATTLSFLGFGPATGYADWGTIISSSRRFLFWTLDEPFRYMFTFVYPTLFLSAFILGWSLVGDALRNVMDPMLRRR